MWTVVLILLLDSEFDCCLLDLSSCFVFLLHNSDDCRVIAEDLVLQTQFYAFLLSTFCLYLIEDSLFE